MAGDNRSIRSDPAARRRWISGRCRNGGRLSAISARASRRRPQRPVPPRNCCLLFQPFRRCPKSRRRLKPTRRQLLPPLHFPPRVPANIPEARYPDQAPAAEAGAQGDATVGAAPPPSAATAAVAPIPAASISTQDAATTPEQMNDATAATSGIPSTPAPLDANPLRPSTQSAPPDRYGANAAATTPIEAAAPTAPPTAAATQLFADSWPAIQAALDRGDLAEGHKLLTRWHDDPSLTPTDAERVDALLSQLAGTVVYSTEHRLAPAHVVKQGETLETIAKEYNVPWQLLAKINGVAAADQVRPGQELKVLRGPFSAVVDLTRKQLSLTVDGRYAGKFPVTVSPGHAIADGEWLVGNKSNEQAPGHALLLKGNAAAPALLHLS